ncbi:MAG TPA: ATP-binding protein, partial [Chitinophagaceae bacterium]|nr:ATP-binding protein [Chitinophagaceae bacterium]
SANKIHVPTDGVELDVAIDKSGNYWGLTTENRGLWHYNAITGKISCSWKGELEQFPAEKYLGKNIIGINYSDKEDVMWLSYQDGKLEKVYLTTGKREFYSFYGDLQVRADTVGKNRHSILSVKTDRENNEWIFVGGKYLVRLDKDKSRFECIVDDPLLPLGKMDWFLLETGSVYHPAGRNTNLLWIVGDKGLSILQKRNSSVRQVSFGESSVAGIGPNDYQNKDNHHNIFFVKGKNNSHLLFQQDAGRPKLIRFDNKLHITDALFNDEWKKYPAYFSTDFDIDTCYIAMMRPDIEPLDFRKVVIKEFRVDLVTFKREEVTLDFSQRVRWYGAADANSCYWLFSNGYLYSYDPRNNLLDSVFISDISKRKPFPLEFVKGFDFPTSLHRNSSTFWIAFVPEKELYKINLQTKKVEKIFKSCFDQKDCDLSTAVLDLYPFDPLRVHLQTSFFAALVNVKNDSITYYSDLFEDRLPVESHIGSGLYHNWICHVSESEINFLDTASGKRKKLSLNEDFKWKLSQFNCRPLMNDQGEMVLMSSAQKGFVIFNIDSVPDPARPGIVHFSSIKKDEKELRLDSLLKSGTLTLKYNSYSNIRFMFSDHSLTSQDKINYEYSLHTGGDTVWNTIEGEPELALTKISPGNYNLLIRAANRNGDHSPEITSLNLSIIPPFTQTAWFILLIIGVIAGGLYGVYRYRLMQLNKLQAIRNNIAGDLHDDIGSTLNSISIYSEVARQQAGKDIPALELIGTNSRRVIESMSDIVWTINPGNDSFEKIIARMRSFVHQLLKARDIEFTFEADEKLNAIVLPMQVRKNLYLVFKEAITNLVKYSGANRVSILLTEENRKILLRIRDNGKGIEINAETQGNGLMNMSRRAKEIRAELNIVSGNGGGTEIELILNKIK